MREDVVLITGASSGIGEAIAREYARLGAKVALVARRKDKLSAIAEELGAERAIALAGDVTKDADLERAVSAAVERFGRLDTAIANAGFGVMGSVDRLDLDDYRRQFETNVFGVLRTVKATLGPVRASRGTIAVVGSVNGFVAFPATSAYAMSKFAVRGLCDSLRAELASDGVTVAHIAPGFVESEIRLRRGGGKDPIPRVLMLPAREAARQIVRGLDARRPEIVVTAHGKVGVLAERVSPGAIRVLMRALGKRIKKQLDAVSG